MHSLNSHATGSGDQGSASAKKILVVALVIEVVRARVVVNIIRAEASIVTVFTVHNTAVKAVAIDSLITNGHSDHASEAGRSVGDVDASLGMHVAEVYEDAEPQLRKELLLVGRELVGALVRVEDVPRGLVILEHLAPKPGAEAVEVEPKVHVAVDMAADIVNVDRLVLRVPVPVEAFQVVLELSQVAGFHLGPAVVREETTSLDFHAVRVADDHLDEVGKGYPKTIAQLRKDDEVVVQDNRLLALGAPAGRTLARGDRLNATMLSDSTGERIISSH